MEFAVDEFTLVYHTVADTLEHLHRVGTSGFAEALLCVCERLGSSPAETYLLEEGVYDWAGYGYGAMAWLMQDYCPRYRCGDFEVIIYSNVMKVGLLQRAVPNPEDEARAWLMQRVEHNPDYFVAEPPRLLWAEPTKLKDILARGYPI